MVRVRWGHALAITAVVGLALMTASCSSPGGGGSPSSSATGSPSPTEIAPTGLPTAPTPSATPITPSTSLDAISATGGFGEKPTVNGPWPWGIDQTRTNVLVQGTGAACNDMTGLMQLNYYGVDATTGNTFDESYSNGSPVTFNFSQGMIAGFIKAVNGQKIGSRLLTAMPGSDGYDANGGNTNAGIQVGDTLIFVIDIVNCNISVADGTPITPTADPSLPTVGGTLVKPTLSIPQVDPPKSLVVQTLIQGSGPTIQAADQIQVDYAEYSWLSGSMVRQTYGFTPLTGALSATLKGWQQAIEGKNSGTRLMVVVPPDLAYPDGNASIKIAKGTTMVYIIDILYGAQS